MEKNNMKINGKVKELRKKKGLTQARVAELLGMKTSSYSQMERMGNIPVQRILNLAAIFDVDPLEILNAGKNSALNVQTDDNNMAVLNQPLAKIDQDDTEKFILTNREKNAIIMLHNMKASDREKIYAMIKELHDKKYKKG